MKIAISISKVDDTSFPAEVFGRCSNFFVFDTVSDKGEVISNPYFIELGGAGIQAAYFLIAYGIDVLITKKIGKNPKRFLQSAKVDVYQCNDCNVFEAIKLFKEGKLSEIENTDDKYLMGKNRFYKRNTKKREKT
jgi:predicted Fe-Mo cluster-binding NifX family protein